MYKERLRIYLWEALALPFCLLLVLMFYIMGHGVHFGFFLIVVLFLTACADMLFDSISSTNILMDLLKSDFAEFKATYVETISTKSEKKLSFNITISNKPPSDIEKKETLHYQVVFKKDKYYHLRSSVFFEMERGKEYLITIAHRTGVLIGVKELDGTEVDGEKRFVEKIFMGSMWRK